tara:strand:- start:13608 stop:14687 length:1080 start_codon:yes stop_codon:yes gene_type:complete
MFNCKSSDLSIKTIEVTSDIKNNVELSDIAKVNNIVSLEYNGFDLFSEIASINRLDDKIIIHSLNPSMISIANENGQIINQLKPDDTDPFSINGITEVKLYNNFIYVLDREHFQINKMNIELERLSNVKLNYYIQSFEPLDNEVYFLYAGHEKTENNSGMFLIYDSKEQKLLDDLIPIHLNTPNFFKFMTRNHIIRLSNNNFLLWDSSKNYIYNYSDSLEENYFIDYGSRKLDDSFYETATFGNSYEFLTEMRKLNYAFRHFNIKSNDNYLNFSYEMEGGFINTLYNTQTGKTYNYKNVNDNLITGLSMPGLNYFNYLTEKDEFIIYLSYEYLSKTENEILKAAYDNNEDVLVFGTLKF